MATLDDLVSRAKARGLLGLAEELRALSIGFADSSDIKESLRRLNGGVARLIRAEEIAKDGGGEVA